MSRLSKISIGLLLAFTINCNTYAADVFMGEKDKIYVDISNVQNFTEPLSVKITHNGVDIYYNSVEVDSEKKYMTIPLSGAVASDCRVSLGGALSGKNIAPSQLPVKIGDYIQLGSYNDEKINWVCSSVDENGILMIADAVVTKEAYSLPDTQKKYSINLWQESDLKNVFFTADGFLSGFSIAETNLIAEVYQRQGINASDSSILSENGEALRFNRYPAELENDRLYSYLSCDKIFIPDIIQIHKAAQNLGPEFVIGKDENGEVYPYWLRTPVQFAAYKDFVYSVDADGFVDIENADNNLIGVRPAFYLNPNSEILSGNGTSESPYILNYTGEKTKMRITKDAFLNCIHLDIIGAASAEGSVLIAAEYDNNDRLVSVTQYQVNSDFEAIPFEVLYDGYNRFFVWYEQSLAPVTDAVKVINNY